MKNNSSRKLLFTTIAIVFLTLLSGLVINLLTSNEDFNKSLKEDYGIQMKHLVIGTVAIGFVLTFLAYLQHKYSEKAETDKEIFVEDIEPDVKKFFDLLKSGIDKEETFTQRIGRFIFRRNKSSEEGRFNASFFFGLSRKKYFQKILTSFSETFYYRFHKKY
jgi:hypothetical protein